MKSSNPPFFSPSYPYLRPLYHHPGSLQFVAAATANYHRDHGLSSVKIRYRGRYRRSIDPRHTRGDNILSLLRNERGVGGGMKCC